MRGRDASAVTSGRTGTFLSILACVAILVPRGADAQTSGADEAPSRPPISVGAGVAVTTQPYLGVDDAAQLFPIPLVNAQVGRFAFQGREGSIDVGEAGPVELQAIARWRFQSYDQDDGFALAGMDRDGTLEVGATASGQLRSIRLSATVTADVLGRHGGFEAEAAASVEVAGGRFVSVRPRAGLRYQSASLNDYYFGVEADEGAVLTDPDTGEAFAREPYAVDATLAPFVGVIARVPVSRRVFVTGLIDYGPLPGEVTDSPIVDASGQAFGFVGLAYAFGGGG